VIGNVWQWTESPINGLSGFEVHPYYDDFSTPTFDERHNLIKESSWISTGNEATRDSRYAFRRHFFQHAGFRYIETEKPVAHHSNPYESDTVVAQYKRVSLWKRLLRRGEFPSGVLAWQSQLMNGRNTEQALDLGCAVGRAALNWRASSPMLPALIFPRVLSRQPSSLRRGAPFATYCRRRRIVSYHERLLSDFGLDSIKHKVDFSRQTPVNLK